MAVFKYAPVPTSEAHGSPGVEMGGVGRRGTGAAVSSRASPSGHHAGGDGDDLVTKRMPYCLGMLVLLAIIYVLSRSEVAQKQQLVQGGDCIADLDIGAYRAKQLANMPPHIIECKEAGEGGAQDACHLPRNKRYAAVGQKGATLWMTGLSGSGKSTIAKALEEELVLRHGVHVYRLDGDNIRTGLNRDLGFSADDRAESVRRVGEMSCLFSDSGTITLVSLVSPYRDDRDEVRRRHEDQGIPFFEIFMDVPLDVVQDRDPKGLYKQVEEGKIKGFTGVDAPYEAPLKAELVLPNYEMTVDECVQALMRLLQAAGILDGSMPDPTGLPMPDGDEVVDLLVPSTLRSSRQEEAASLPKVPLTDIDLNWLQTIGEGWASPLRGFMREGVLLQSLHFASYLVDPHNVTSEAGLYSKPTDFAHLPANRPPDRVSMSVPITLAITEYTKAAIEGSGKKAVALTTKDGATVAILRRPEIYANRKEEIVTRTFGVIDPGHPYIANIYSGGEWLIGGEVELIEPIKFFDGLDKWRLSARELREELAMKGADVVYAFQTRNPTHAGHAYLMRTAGERLKAQGYTRPVLWLSPLGGWTKEDDVPLDVRVKQHEAVLDAGMLDPDSTVMAIWPAPMIYGGPTEVQFHAKSRRCGGASFFVVGRDPAGMKGSELAEAHPDDDLYDPEHGRYVLAMSPGVGNMKMLDFEQVYYDKKTHTMTVPDPSRPDDFISISGSKMRALARQGAKPCPSQIPSDLLAANCIPPGFMVQKGWDIVCDYYQHVDDKVWVPYARRTTPPKLSADSFLAGDGAFGTKDFKLFLTDRAGSGVLSPWHDVPLQVADSGAYNMVVEIPMFSSAKMEVQKGVPFNPIMQDMHDDGTARFFKYGAPAFNYGLLPQTWEDPHDFDPASGRGGDNDPLDVMEFGGGPLPMGGIVPVKVLGVLNLIDEGETDYKILALRMSDPLADKVSTFEDLEVHKPGTTALLVDWLLNYKMPDGKPANLLASQEPSSPAEAKRIIDKCAQRWQALREEGATLNVDGHCLSQESDTCNYSQPPQ